MGPDSGLQNGSSVVDTNTKVYGTDNLFVVDASIFPGMVSTNPSALIVAAAERAAELILASANHPDSGSSSSIPTLSASVGISPSFVASPAASGAKSQSVLASASMPSRGSATGLSISKSSQGPSFSSFHRPSPSAPAPSASTRVAQVSFISS